MRLVIQRVKEASVAVEGKIVGKIGPGMLIFLGIAKDDSLDEVDHFVKKVTELRIFEDANGKMNLAAGEVKGEFLVVSQFTLVGDCGKGRRPSFDQAADPQQAEEFYNFFIQKLRSHHAKVQAGQFRAMMEVALINDGPVTFVLESSKS